MTRRMRGANWTAPALTCIAAAALIGCGSDGSDDPGPDEGAALLTVPKVASCATGDVPETALQGQVPAALRASGYEGFNCNLKLVGQFQGEGGNWSSATFNDSAGHSCAYHATAVPNANRKNPGVPVIDMTDPSKPKRVESLTTPSMLDPWESLRVNDKRQILIADNGQNGAGGPEIDIYDLSGDCRSPQLLATTAVGTGEDGGVKPPTAPFGHEGNLAPDGLTYYIGDTLNAIYYAVDIANTTKPKLIASYSMSQLGLKEGTNVHGLSVSSDGNRLYGVVMAFPPTPVVNDINTLNNGFAIFDTSEVQARKPNAQIKPIATALFQDGTLAQHTIPATIGGKPYVVMVDEGGSAGLADEASAKVACAANLSPFPMARIYDISDETKPALASKLMLETHDPKNCSQVTPDLVGLSAFTYGSHYCSVDNRYNATALACSYFNSGIRVFDIRDPARPKEIAYYNPKSPSAVPGSTHSNIGQRREGGPDWCASRLDFDFEKKQLVTMCQDSGLLILEFAPDTWPFSQSTPSRDQS